MAVNLSAVFRVQDRGSQQLRKITQVMDRMNKAQQQASKSADTFRDANGRLRNSMGRFIAEGNRASGMLGRFNSSLNGTKSSASVATVSLNGIVGAVAGVAAAYLSAQAASKAFNATLGAAATYQQSEAIIKATFKDDGATKQYMQMVDKIAIDSPLLSSGEMFSSSKGLLTLSTDMSQLESAWGLVERLIASNPTKNIDDAVRGMRELASGDTMSLRDVFNLDKNILNDVKNLSFEDQLAGIDKALNKMNITSDTVEAMGSTTLGLWAQIQERAGKFFRDVGGEGNNVLGEQFKKALAALDTVDLSSIATDIGSKIADGIQLAADAITFVKNNMDEFKGILKLTREIVIGLTSAFVAHRAILGGLMLYNAIATAISLYRNGTLLATAATWLFNTALFANPVGLVIGLIAGLIGIIVLLVRNWDTVTAKTKEVWSAIGGGSGAIALILGPLGFLINAAIDLAKNWDSTKSVWQNVWSSIQRSAATSINAVIGLINSLINTINKIPGIEIKEISKVDWSSVTAPPNLGAAGISNAIDGSHYHGLDYVPSNQYTSILHKGEAVLPRQEAQAWREGKSGGNTVNITMNGLTIREEADIDKLAYKFATALEQEVMRRGR